MSVKKNQCHRCGERLAPGESGRLRWCERCALALAAEADDAHHPPVDRGEKPPDHGLRVARGIRIALLAKRAEARARSPLLASPSPGD